MRDLSSVYTRYTYDPRGRVKTITAEDPATSTGNAVTSLDYDIEGRVSSVTLPSTETMTIEYDLAGRTTKVKASNNERIEYEYDLMSNMTSMKVKRSDNTDANVIINTFDTLGRMLTQTLGGARQRSWSYDKNGNVETATGARSMRSIDWSRVRQPIAALRASSWMLMTGQPRSPTLRLWRRVS
jgi:YD repeat-containing protein